MAGSPGFSSQQGSFTRSPFLGFAAVSLESLWGSASPLKRFIMATASLGDAIRGASTCCPKGNRACALPLPRPLPSSFRKHTL